MNEIENERIELILAAMSEIAEIFGKSSDFEEYIERAATAKAKALEGLTQAAGEDFDKLEEDFPTLHRLSNILGVLSHEIYHDCAHELHFPI